MHADGMRLKGQPGLSSACRRWGFRLRRADLPAFGVTRYPAPGAVASATSSEVTMKQGWALIVGACTGGRQEQTIKSAISMLRCREV
jgi:hypothetical protein